MVRRALYIALLIFITTLSSSYASNDIGSIKTTIYDKDAPNTPIVGAVVELSPVTDPEMMLYFASDANGVLVIPSIKHGDYTLKFTSLGYTPKRISVSLKKSEQLLLPNVLMETSAVALDEVVKEVKALRASQKGDTLNYNASSFKVADDADVEGLISKMPGISIENGELSAQGETVKRIFVDGREFFGGDVTAALKSLPAEVVERIEVYENLSDEAKFSGVDDGKGEKAINIVTKPSMREGAFGKVYAGYGYEPDTYSNTKKSKYLIGGNVNIFQNTSRITLLGLYNNVNQQSFSHEDIMGVADSDDGSSGGFQMKSDPGISNVQAFGVNYSDVFGEKDKLKIQGSYFYNDTNTTNEENTDRWYEQGSGSTIDSLDQRIDMLTHKINHRFNGKIDWDINESNSFMIRPTMSIQTNDQYRYTYGIRYKPNNVYQVYQNWRAPNRTGYNVGASANYRKKLGKKGSTITVGGGFGANNWSSDTDRETLPTETYDLSDYLDDPESVVPKYGSSQFRDEESQSRKFNYNGSVGYNARINSKITLSTTYRYSRNFQESDKLTLETDDLENPFVVDPGRATMPLALSRLIKLDRASVTTKIKATWY